MLNTNQEARNQILGSCRCIFLLLSHKVYAPYATNACFLTSKRKHLSCLGAKAQRGKGDTEVTGCVLLPGRFLGPRQWGQPHLSAPSPLTQQSRQTCKAHHQPAAFPDLKDLPRECRICLRWSDAQMPSVLSHLILI